jgi:hypothetical protein
MKGLIHCWSVLRFIHVSNSLLRGLDDDDDNGDDDDDDDDDDDCDDDMIVMTVYMVNHPCRLRILQTTLYTRPPDRCECR